MFCQSSSLWLICLPWVALHGMAHSFIKLTSPLAMTRLWSIKGVIWIQFRFSELSALPSLLFERLSGWYVWPHGMWKEGAAPHAGDLWGARGPRWHFLVRYNRCLCARWLTVEGGLFLWAAALLSFRELPSLCPTITDSGCLCCMPGPWGARTLLPSRSGHLAKQGCITMPAEGE